MAEPSSSETPSSESPPLKGMTKAAILLVSLDPECSATLMRQLDQETIEDLTREIAQLDRVLPDVRGKVIEEYYNLAMAMYYVKQGGIVYAKQLLDNVLPADQAARILRVIELQVHKQPFSFLAKTDAENLITFIQDEHPQTIALILSYLHSTKGSEILSGLALEKQVEVVTRIAQMDNTNPEVIKEVEKGLEMRLSGLVSQTTHKAGGRGGGGGDA